MKIALMQLSHHNRPYKNPYRLQAVCFDLRNRCPGIDVVIYDVDAVSGSNIPYADCAVIDTSETDFCDIEAALQSNQIGRLFLFGDVINYGDGQAAKAYLEARYHETPIHFATEICIIDDIISHIGDIGCIENASALPSSEMESNSEINNAFCKKGLQYIAKGVSDGCEMRCSFCRHSCADEPVRYFACPSLSTIQTVYDVYKNPVFVQFSDDNFFGINQRRLNLVLELTQQLHTLKGAYCFGVDTRIDSLFPSLPLTGKMRDLQQLCWQEMLSVGLKYCFLGVESFSPEQLRRYNKYNDLEKIADCIRFFDSKSLAYTFGLILWDPCMTYNDLRTNLSAINSFGLLGQTASLWKPLRIPFNSLYRKRYFPAIQRQGSQNYYLLSENISLYCDPQIHAMAQYVFPLYHVFSNGGYRHSDASSYTVLLEKDDPDILRMIPKKIAELEMRILEDLFRCSFEVFSPERNEEYYSECEEKCKEIIDDLLAMPGPISKNAVKLKNYYYGTFSKVIQLLNYERQQQ